MAAQPPHHRKNRITVHKDASTSTSILHTTVLVGGLPTGMCGNHTFARREGAAMPQRCCTRNKNQDEN